MSRRICTTDRSELRAWIPASYSVTMHLSGLVVGSVITLVVLAVSFASRVHAVDLIAMPVTFFIGSLLEYITHRWLMHVPRFAPLRLAWDAHTGRHHYFYRRDAPTWEAPRDIWLILFSPIDTLVLIAILAAPVALLYSVIAPGAWAIIVASVVLYFLAYELLHLLFHLPDGHVLLGLPGVSYMRRRHLRHHDLEHTDANYGVTNPLWDVLFRTERGPVTLDGGLVSHDKK